MITKQYDLKEGNENIKEVVDSLIINIRSPSEENLIKQISHYWVGRENSTLQIIAYVSPKTLAKITSRERAPIELTGESHEDMFMALINLEKILSKDLIEFNPLNYKEHSKI